MIEREPPKGYVYIEGQILIDKEEQKAILFWDGDKKKEWLPRSLIEDIEETGEVTVEILLPEWLAFEKGLI